MKKIIFIILFIAALLLSVAFTQHNQIEAITVENYTNLNNGIYEGTFKTTLVSAKVNVEILNNQILDIILVEHNHGLGSDAEDIIPIILEKNTPQVDTISGATHSSQVIKKAVENALNKARKDI